MTKRGALGGVVICLEQDEYHRVIKNSDSEWSTDEEDYARVNSIFSRMFREIGLKIEMSKGARKTKQQRFITAVSLVTERILTEKNIDGLA